MITLLFSTGNQLFVSEDWRQQWAENRQIIGYNPTDN